tara:strand:+ start:590 stop:1147 length:558 start_codon:yes stop_codon:yes gene_type:complete
MLKTKWEDNNNVTNCRRCLNKFTLFIRKHHCRKCGKVFCHLCLKNYFVFDKSNLICIDCITVLNNYIIVDKNKYTDLKNKVKTYETVNLNKTFSNAITQTENIYKNECENIIIENNNNFKSKSLDILECFHSIKKKNDNKIEAKNEIIKYTNDKNKRYYNMLKNQETLLLKKEKELKKLEEDLKH